MGYIADHWRGRLPLWQAFWINMVLLSMIIGLIEYFLYRNLQIYPDKLVIAMSVSFVVFHVLVFTWQAVGVLRTSDRKLKDNIHTSWPRTSQLGVVCTFAATLVWGVSLIQDLMTFRAEQSARMARTLAQADYEISISDNTLVINGLFAPGITRETGLKLDQQHSIETIILNSKGGNIYEARGLARLIRENSLSTLSTTGCFSACITAYLAGAERLLSAGANLGFHQYKIDSNKLLPRFVKTEYEQAKDLEYFQSRGIDAGFLEKVFSLPPDKMWRPEHHVLLEAGVVTKIIAD